MKSIFLLIFSLILFLACQSPSEMQSGNIPPIIKITYPTNGMTVFGVIDIKCEVRDEEDISKVVLIIDDKNLGVSDNEFPYTFKWNTQVYQNDSFHKICVMSIDTSDNSSTSDTLQIKVNNSGTSFVDTVKIKSVDYDRYLMTITWYKSDLSNFAYYELYHADSTHGMITLISTKYSNIDTVHVIDEFDPTHENWFWVIVTDSLGISSDFGSGFMVIDSPPDPTILDYVQFIDNSFNISWQKNNNEDFECYELYESGTQNIDNSKLIYQSNERNETKFSVDNIMLDEFRYYKVIVYDYWNLNSESQIRRGSSYPLIVYYSYKNGNNEIFISDIDGEDDLQITNQSSNEKHPVFSPDGSKIIYNKENNLFSMGKYGDNKIQLTNNTGQNEQVKFSPDGSKIVFCSTQEGNWDIFIMNIDGTQQWKLINNEGFDTWPSFLPDGNSIAFISDISGNAEIYIMDINQSNLNKITSNLFNKDHLQVAPDGKSIIYVLSDMPAEEDIYSVNISTKESINLTNRGNSDYAPIISPDGTKIFYQSMSDSWDIWSMDLDGGNKFNITNSSSNDVVPDVLYDGSIIVFQLESGGVTKIHSIDRYGNNLKEITHDSHNSYFPKFQKRNNY